MSIKTALNEVGKFVEDVATVEVETYTGSVKHINDALALDENDATGRFNAIRQHAKTSTNLKLAFATVLDFSGDAILFRAEDETIATEALENAHKAAVTSGIQSRQAIIDLFKDLVGLD
jgi:hypothetical protein